MKFSFKLGRFSLSLGGRGTRRPGGVICSQPGRKSTETSAITSDSVRSKANSPIQAWLRGAEIPSESPILVSPFQQSVWVYTVVSALAQTVSAIPFRISSGDRSGENILTKGAVVELFKRPHPSLNRFRFWEFIVTWYCLRGEAFIVALDKSGSVLPIPRSSPPSHFPSPSHTGRGVRGEGDGRGASGEGSDHAPTLSRPNAPHSLLVLNPDNFRHVVEGSELLGW